jgi:hypothetical protein
VAEGIPDGRALAVGTGSAFDLEGAGRDSPGKGGGEWLVLGHNIPENDFMAVQALDLMAMAVSIF